MGDKPNKVNVRDLQMDLGLPDQNAGYTVQHPDKDNPDQTHHSMFTGDRGEHYSFNTDEQGDVVPGTGHYTPPHEKGEPSKPVSQEPPAPEKPDVRVTFNPDCLWD